MNSLTVWWDKANFYIKLKQTLVLVSVNVHYIELHCEMQWNDDGDAHRKQWVESSIHRWSHPLILDVVIVVVIWTVLSMHPNRCGMWVLEKNRWQK